MRISPRSRASSLDRPEGPHQDDVLRDNPFGRIAFANSDLAGIMDHRTSILEANRAVAQSMALRNT